MLEYKQKVGEAHCKRFGQFFTPPAVARFMVRWVGRSDGEEIFDPAFGLGAFHEQLSKSRQSGFSAMELDTDVLDYWSAASKQAGAFIVRGDYLQSWGLSHRNIVCNPPYMRFQKFLNRDAVFADFEEQLGIRLSGYTNTASAFLMKSVMELAEGGRLAYIMPLEFLNTGYGKIVKEFLLRDRHLAAIISLDCEKEVFPDVTTSVGIVLYDKSIQHEHVAFHSFKSILELEQFEDALPISEVDYSEIDSKEKWLPHFQTSEFIIDSDLTTTLQHYGRFSRGIATGANEFFSLTRSQIKSLGLCEDVDCVPCVTRSPQIKNAFFNGDDLDRLKSEDKPVFLFSVNTRCSQQAADYIKEGERNGYHERFLTKNRKPWFKTETRQSARLLLGVFSRGGYKVICNTSGALNLTCYHGFQPNLFGINYEDHLFLYLSSNSGRKVISLSARKYGNALDKFEPNDINSASVPLPEFFDLIPDERIQHAIEEYKSTLVVPQWLEAEFERIIIPPADQPIEASMGRASSW